MHAQRDRQPNIGSSAGTCDKDKIIAIFGFGEYLVQVGVEHGGVDDGKVDTRGEGDDMELFGRGVQDKRACFGQKVIGFGDAEVVLGEGVFIAVGGDEFHTEGGEVIGNLVLVEARGIPDCRFADVLFRNQILKCEKDVGWFKSLSLARQLIELGEKMLGFRGS